MERGYLHSVIVNQEGEELLQAEHSEEEFDPLGWDGTRGVFVKEVPVLPEVLDDSMAQFCVILVVEDGEIFKEDSYILGKEGGRDKGREWRTPEYCLLEVCLLTAVVLPYFYGFRGLNQTQEIFTPRNLESLGTRIVDLA